MMKKRWLGLAALAVFLPLLSVNAAAAYDMTATLTDGANTAAVHSWVEDFTGFYRYYYKITTTSTNVNFFAVELPDGCSLMGVTGKLGPGTKPLMWEIDDPATSISAYFNTQIAAGGSSWTLFFDAVDAPTLGDAMASGFGNGQFNVLTGSVYTPNPEPTTIALLGLGMGLIARRKRA